MSEEEKSIPIVIVILIYLCTLLGVVTFGEPTVDVIYTLTLATIITIVAKGDIMNLPLLLILLGAVSSDVSQEASPISATPLIGVIAILVIGLGTLYYIEHIR